MNEIQWVICLYLASVRGSWAIQFHQENCVYTHAEEYADDVCDTEKLTHCLFN